MTAARRCCRPQAGATYVDTPARFAIAARVDDFERVSLIRRLGGWTDLGTTVGAGPFDVKVQTNDPTVNGDALLVEGTVEDLPHVLDASVRPPSEQHDGALGARRQRQTSTPSTSGWSRSSRCWSDRASTRTSW